MKVVHLIGGGDVGGAKTHVLYLLKELSRHIEVKLICLRPGAFAEDAQKIGIDVEVVNSGNILSDIRKTKKIISDGHFDIIHSHGAKANIFSLTASHYLKLPTVTTVHSDYKLDYMHSLPRRITIGLMNTIALRFINNYIAISSNFRNMLVARNFSPENIYILYNGMDFSESSMSYSKESLIKKYNLNMVENDIIVGIASRLYPVKSIETIIRAAALVKEKNKNVKFLIGGDGEDMKKLVALTESLGLKDTVFFTGWLDDPNELMSCVDISVLTSISESFPYSILEGARFKKATISTDVGGIPDLITNNENGFLFSPGDYRKFSELILELSTDEQKRSEMGEKLYQKAFEHFSKEAMCRTQLDIYKNIILKSASSKKTAKKYDAIISGYYGFQNIGDDALLMSIITDLNKYCPGIKILVLSKNPTETSSEFGVDSISRVSMLKILKAMKNARSFIYGGGNLLQDNTSTRSLLFYLGIVLLAKKMKLKVMFYANGIGPLENKINRMFTKKIVNKVDVITLRERLSFSELNHMEISKPRVQITADSAFSITHSINTNSKEVLRLLDIDTTRQMIGISLRRYPGRGKVQHENYEDVIAQLVDFMSEKYDLLPVFIPMKYPDDLQALENVSCKMKSNSVVIKHKLNVAQTYTVISNMSMLVGMRLHALIFSASAGVPMLGLVYDPKVEGFLEYINQPSAGNVREIEFESLKLLAEDIWNRRNQINEQLKKDVLVLTEKAEQNAKVAVELISGNN